MSGQDAKPVRTPFQQQQSQVNTFGLAPSVAETPEAQALLDVPLDFGDDTGIDPGVGRRTDLAEQEATNRINSAFNGGTPRFIREASLAKDLREIRGRGADETQQAEYMRKQLDNQRRTQRTLTDLERKRLLVPGVVQTGGSGTSSGFNTQVTQPQPGFLQSFAGGLGAGIGGALQFPKI